MPGAPRSVDTTHSHAANEASASEVKGSPREQAADTRTATATRLEEPGRAAPLAADTRIGRYQIIGLLGSGGLGAVYRAHDAALARDVALKILHRRIEPGARDAVPRQRLLQEGQALAKLSHPNVVTIYDVGIEDDTVFIAMQLVQGRSLDAWLHAGAPRSDVLRVLIAAGRGLAAAHAAGLTHGDFKPANVMLSREGQVRIVDFGLARTIADGGAAHAGGTSDAGAAPSADAASHTTSLRGTPGYIAPELMLHPGAADAQADQYSFAVTAFLALTGRKPYAGQTPEEYQRSLTSGPRPVWPGGVPRRICRIVERGMAASPAERYPSLEALVDALERAATQRRSSAAWLALSVVALLVASGAGLARVRAHRARCEVDATPFAGVWDAERRAALERSLLATRHPNAAEAFTLLAARLDAFEAGWLEMQREACSSSLVSGAQPERLFALRSTCLKHKLQGLAALVEAFSSADARAVDRAAAAMPDSVEECADIATLTGAADALPADPAKRAAIEQIASRNAVIRADFVAGRDARAAAREQHEAALAAGHPPTIAMTLSMMARAVRAVNQSDASLREVKQMLTEVMRLAAEAGDRRLLAQTASYLFIGTAYRGKRTDEAEAMFPMVDALVNQAGNDPEARLEALVGQGAILTQRGKYLEANAVLEQAVELSRRVQSERRAYGPLALGQIGENYIELRRYPEAVRGRQAELEGLRSMYGARHPRVLLSMFNLGFIQVKAGYLDAARETAANLRELGALLLLPDDWRQATLPFLDGIIAEGAGDCAAAIPSFRAALRQLDVTVGPEHANTADVYERLGSCLHRLRHGREALTHLEHALAIRRAQGGAPKIAECAFHLAEVLWARDPSERARALALATEAISLWQRTESDEARLEAERWLAERSVRSASAEPVAPSRGAVASSATP